MQLNLITRRLALRLSYKRHAALKDLNKVFHPQYPQDAIFKKKCGGVGR